ncbi:MAG: hypothetical protein B7Z40_18330, partial [Bosea sp. 12-68-7]
MAAASWDAQAWTFDVVLSAGSAVVRQDARGVFDEVLDVSGATWPETIPMLDSHRRGSLEDQIGSVSNIRREGGQLIGTARLSKHSPMAQRVAAEIGDGAKFGVSIGYSVGKFVEATKSGRRTLTATSFSLLEISLVSIPADPAATIRNLELTTPTTNATTAPQNTAITDTGTAVVAPQTRAALSAEVRSIATAAGLDGAWTATQLDADTIDLDAVRAAAITALQTRTAAAAAVRSTHNEQTLDNPDVRIRAAGEALYARSNPAHQVSPQARAFVGMGTVDLARSALTHSGQSTTGLSPATIVQRALHTTSDFPLILGDSVNRTLRQGYDAAPSGLKRIGRQTTARDFRDKHRLNLSEAPRLEKVNEAGEFKSGTLAEERQSYRLATYGRVINISRQALINDDLGAFVDLARRIGQASAATEAQLLVDLLLANSAAGPTMSDGKALFHADHKNLQTAAAFDLTPLSVMRTAMRKQVGLTGELISIDPKFLLIPAELETIAEQKLRTVLYPAASANAATDSMKLLEIVVEPRLVSATAYYLGADPAS